MSATTKVKLKSSTKKLIGRRRLWRARAVDASLTLVTWPAGKPGREKVESEVVLCIRKLREWFGDRRSQAVIMAV